MTGCWAEHMHKCSTGLRLDCSVIWRNEREVMALLTQQKLCIAKGIFTLQKPCSSLIYTDISL